MSFNFPISPTDGDTYAPPGGPVWHYGQGAWRQAPVTDPITYTTHVITPQMFGAQADGVTDDTAAVQNAVNSLAGGGVLYFIEPGEYLVSTVNLLSNITIDLSPGVIVRHKPDATTSLLVATGAKSGSTLALAADVQAGVTSFALTNASTITAGAWIILKDTTDFATDSAALGYKSGESLIVKSKATNTLNFDRKISGSFQADRAYTIARGGNVELVSAPLRDICVRGEGKIIGHKNYNVSLIDFSYVDGARVEGVHLETFGGAGCLFRTCRNVICKPRYVADGRNDVAAGFPGYGIAVAGACDVVLVADAFVTRTRHAFTTLGGSNGNGGPSRITVDNLTVTENDFVALDTHAGVHDIVFSNNKVYGGNVLTLDGGISGGISTRAETTRMLDNTVVGVPGNAYNVVGETLQKIIIEGNYAGDCGGSGINVSSTVNGLDILRNTILRTGGDGIRALGGSYDTGVSRILIKGNVVRDFGRTVSARAGIMVSTATASVAHIEDNTVESVNGNEGRGVYVSGALVAGSITECVVRGTYTSLAYQFPESVRGQGNINQVTPNGAYIAILDDTVYDLVGVAPINLLFGISVSSVGPNQANGIFSARTNATPQCFAITTFGANIVFTTGVLTGTTGTDGNFTISAANGHIYFENRIGATQTAMIQQIADYLRT